MVLLLSLKGIYIRQALLLHGSCSLDLHRLNTATCECIFMHVNTLQLMMQELQKHDWYVSDE